MNQGDWLSLRVIPQMPNSHQLPNGLQVRAQVGLEAFAPRKTSSRVFPALMATTLDGLALDGTTPVMYRRLGSSARPPPRCAEHLGDALCVSRFAKASRLL